MNTKDAKLLLEIAHAQNLQELVDLGCELLGNPVFIDDMYRNILAYSQNVSIDDPLWQENIVENIHDESSKSQLTSKNNYKISLEMQHPILLTDLPTAQRYAMTLTHYGAPIGNATLAAHLRPFSEGDDLLFELFCTYASELLCSSHYSIRHSQPIVINTLIRLLDGDRLSRTAVESKLPFYGKDKTGKEYLLLLSDQSGDALSCPRQVIIDSLSLLPDVIAFSYQSYILAIISANSLREAAENTELLRILKKYQLFAGFSNQIRDIMQLSLYYSQAQTALQLNPLTEKERVCPYSDIAVFDCFRILEKKTDLMNYCDEAFQDLYAYDKAHEGNLLKTLLLHLENSLQYELTAKQLFVHKNTVRYRIAKCQQILNTDFTDGHQNFRYLFSLKILEYLHAL